MLTLATKKTLKSGCVGTTEKEGYMARKKEQSKRPRKFLIQSMEVCDDR
jgi:hypothetical protein